MRFYRTLMIALVFLFGGCADADQTGSVFVPGLDSTFSVNWILNDDFADNESMNRWTVESQGSEVTFGDGVLHVRKRDVERDSAGVTVWYNEDLPSDVLIMVDARTASGNHACNLNFFVHAREADGRSLKYGRSGDYPEYHNIPNRLFTLTGGWQSGWSRARRNPGFNLVGENTTVRSEPDHAYSISIAVHGTRVSYAVNGILVHDYIDELPLQGGRFGLRTWFSDIDYDRVRIGEIIH